MLKPIHVLLATHKLPVVISPYGLPQNFARTFVKKPVDKTYCLQSIRALIFRVSKRGKEGANSGSAFKKGVGCNESLHAP